MGMIHKSQLFYGYFMAIDFADPIRQVPSARLCHLPRQCISANSGERGGPRAL